MNRPALEMPGLMSSTVSRYFNNVLLSDEYSPDVLEENRRTLFKAILFYTSKKVLRRTTQICTYIYGFYACKCLLMNRLKGKIKRNPKVPFSLMYALTLLEWQVIHRFCEFIGRGYSWLTSSIGS